MRAYDLINKWIGGTVKYGKASSVSVRGSDLFSYDLKIAEIDGTDVRLSNVNVSPTTSKAIGLVRSVAHRNGFKVTPL